MRRKLGVLAAVTLLFATAGAGAETELFEGDLKSLKVGDTARITATISNPLPIEDEIRLKLQGSALMTGLISLSPDDPGLVALAEPNTYRVTVGPDETEDFNFTASATATGQGVLVGVVNSSVSDLANRDELEVRVDSRFTRSGLSAPGLTAPHLFVIVFLAGLALFFRPD